MRLHLRLWRLCCSPSYSRQPPSRPVVSSTGWPPVTQATLHSRARSQTTHYTYVHTKAVRYIMWHCVCVCVFACECAQLIVIKHFFVVENCNSFSCTLKRFYLADTLGTKVLQARKGSPCFIVCVCAGILSASCFLRAHFVMTVINQSNWCCR